MESIIPPLCACGCGERVKLITYQKKQNKFLFNHHFNLNKLNYPLCKCGCGKKVVKKNNKYYPGHYTIKESNLCKCGCGLKTIHPQSKYYPGHYELTTLSQKIIKYRKELPLCQCGCGLKVLHPYNKYYLGHYSILLNKNKQKVNYNNAPLCQCGCGKKVKWHGTSISGFWNKFLQGHNQKLIENREKKRIIMSKQHCPNIGLLEREIFPILQLHCSYNIKCLENQLIIHGSHLDGYIEELNLIIEIDEKYHDNNQQLDKIREDRLIKKMNCSFFRIRESDWRNRKEEIITNFINKVDELTKVHSNIEKM